MASLALSLLRCAATGVRSPPARFLRLHTHEPLRAAGNKIKWVHAAGLSPLRASWLSAACDGDSGAFGPAKVEVVLFWDLDNLVPDTDPSECASELIALAELFGTPRALVAAGNRSTFDFQPAWFEPPCLPADDTGRLRCPLCGHMQKSQEALERHFKVPLLALERGCHS